MRPAPHDRELGDPLVLDDLGLLGEFIEGLRRRGYSRLLQHVLVVEKVLGVEDPRHAPALAVIVDGGPRAVEHLCVLFGGNALGDVLQKALAAKFSRPDNVEQNDVVAGAAGALRGDDLVVQRFVGHEFELDLDPGILLLESFRHGADVVLAVSRL